MWERNWKKRTDVSYNVIKNFVFKLDVDLMSFIRSNKQPSSQSRIAGGYNAGEKNTTRPPYAFTVWLSANRLLILYFFFQMGWTIPILPHRPAEKIKWKKSENVMQISIKYFLIVFETKKWPNNNYVLGGDPGQWHIRQPRGERVVRESI